MALCVRYVLPTLFAIAANAQNVLTGGYDLARSNADINETYLTPQTVNPSQFGKVFTLPADGQIYAQPLYQRNLTISGTVHNVVFIVTAHNSVYAYDADTAGSPLWTVNLGPSVPTTNYNSVTTTGYTDIAPENGILGTPVIDASTATIYVVAANYLNGNYSYQLHALDTTSGAEKFNGPQQIYAQVRGNGDDNQDGLVTFNAGQEIQRPALLLLNGVVYVSFGSHGDGSPWHGWIMGYTAANITQQTAVFNATPNGYGGSLWQSGRGLSADSQGNIYAVTANGSTDDVTGYSENVLRLNPKDLSVADWFTPSDYPTLNDDDEDLGSSGAILLPGTSLLVTGGKQGMAYLLNTGSLGHTAGNDAQIPQSFNAANVGLYNMAFWNNSLYSFGGNGPLSAYPFSGTQFGTTPSSQSSSGFAVAYYGITVSANGNTPGSGIVWMTSADTFPLPSSGTLHAFDAGNLASELWNSSVNSSRDSLGTFMKFVNPTVANGKVYMATPDGQLIVYGLLGPSGGGAAAPVVTGLANAASYSNGSIAPGEIVDIFGQNLGPQTLAAGSYDQSGKLLVGLAGMEVTFNGVPAPIVYASAPVMAVIVPFEVSANSQAAMQVTYDGVPSQPVTYNVVPSAPGIFTDDSSGSGQAAILNQDYSLNSATNPAPQGSYISVYATGGGQTNPPDSTGATAQGAAGVTLPVTATIGGQNAPVLYAGHAPEEVAGVMQVNLQVPTGITGDQPVIITIGGVASQTTATVAVQ